MSQFLTDRNEIEAWLHKVEIEHYTINSDLTVDVPEHVSFQSYHAIGKFPVQFGKISGSFSCGSQGLTSLLGCPTYVAGFFGCSYNQLVSLEHCPEHVGQSFYFANNQVATLKYLPKYIGHGEFSGDNNPVKSHVLGLLLVDGLTVISSGYTMYPRMVDTIVDRHLKTKDVFACQQELIEAGYEEYAQL